MVGKVLTREQHPNADKLSLCTVDVGEANGGVKQIVCGADNFAAGDIVAVSLSGAVLENGLKLKKANLRGVESDGMMMSEQELGFEEKSPGIVVLPGDWVVGAPLQDYLPVSEAVLELELTSNRPDCFSIYGIAREVAAAAGVELAPPPTAEPAVFGGAPAEESIAVEVADADLCPRYAARVIRGVARRRVAGVAQGAPHARRHAAHQQRGRRDQLRDARLGPAAARLRRRPRSAATSSSCAAPGHGEKIVTLDEVERTLDGEMLVIADVERPLVIAGVFGSVDAEVDEQTTDLVLEAANFSGPSILRTELHTGIRSEASNRFEKGLDAELVPGGLAFASRLFAELCGGTVAPGTVDVRSACRRRGACATGRRRATPCSATPCRRRSRPPSCAVSSARSTSARRADAAVEPSSGRSRRRASVPTSSARSTSSRRSGASPATGLARDAAAPRHRGRADEAAAGAARRAARPGRLRPRRGHHLRLRRARRLRAARPARGRRAPAIRCG